MKFKNYLFSVITLLISSIVIAQPSVQLVDVMITPDHSDWTYDVGEKASFSIAVFKNNVPLKGVEVEYTLQPDAGYRNLGILEEGKLSYEGKPLEVNTKGMDEPGFLRCSAKVSYEGKDYVSYTTIGFSPEKIAPTTTLPSDFEAFWNKGMEELSNIPVNPVLTLIPERCTEKVDVYHVSLDNIKGKIYGVLCKPKAEGRYPVILHVPGAGVRPYYGEVGQAEKGFITFTIGIHGIPVNLDPKVYDDLRQGALSNYNTMNLDDKENAYYRRVYLGCIRAVDFLVGLEEYDGENLAVTGGSQGGALSIVTAGLDQRVKYLAAFYPALSDLTGFLNGRAGGWPQIFMDDFTNKPEKIETSKYFDVVNFARFVKVPGWYSWGYNDNVCPPASMYAAYNVIHAEKALHVFQETQHWTFPEQRELKDQWLFKQLSKE